MNMSKKNLVVAVAAATGLLASGQAAAIAYDSSLRNGLQPVQWHAIDSKNDGTACGPACLGISSQFAESQYVYAITNPTVGIEDGLGPYSVSTPDTWVCDTDATGAVIAGNSTGSLDASGNCAGGVTVAQTAFVPAIGAQFAAPNQEVLRFDLSTDATGKITSGWLVSELDFGGQINIYYWDFDSRAGCTWSNGTALDLDVAAIRANLGLTSDTDADAHCDAYNGASFIGGAALVREGGSNLPFSYATCDTLRDCGASAKAVPVPALAAAALGLGLAGVTYLTGRRKKIAK